MEALTESNFEGDMGTPHAPNWMDLPPELEEQILAKCSVLELARLATTCKIFRAVFCRELRGEQKARHDLALQCFGRERIMCIAAAVDRYLKREPVYSDSTHGEDVSFYVDRNVTTTCRISADGVLHNEGRGDHFFGPSDTYLTKDGDILIEIDIQRTFDGAYGMNLYVIEPSLAGSLHMYVSRGEVTHIRVWPDGDVRSVALVQALLTGDLPDTQADLADPHSVLAPPFGDAAQPVTLEICPSTRLDRELTRPELLALIAPLVPLGPRCKFLGTSASLRLYRS